METEFQPISDFLVLLEKTLNTRLLYASNIATYQDATHKLLDSFNMAAGKDGFSLSVGPTDLFVGDASVLRREKNDAFFFPLFRDGLRTLTFNPGLTLDELESLLKVLESERSSTLNSTEDIISYLWRSPLEHVGFTATDGIGDGELEDSAGISHDEFQDNVARMMAEIKDPLAAGASADGSPRSSRGSESRRESGARIREQIQTRPELMYVDPDQVRELRREAESNSEAELLGRFEEIMTLILIDPARPLPAESLAPVFERLLLGYWDVGEFSLLCTQLAHLKTASLEAPNPESRVVAQETLSRFLTNERVAAIFGLVESGDLPPEQALVLWDLMGDDIWEPLLDYWRGIEEGVFKDRLKSYLCVRLAAKPELLRQTLSDRDGDRVHAGLALLNERVEPLFSTELLAMAHHPDETIRLKGVAAAGRLGGEAALAVIWKAMENDPARPVRLLAFRLASDSPVPQLRDRLIALISESAFAQRPLWEREKYVRLLGAVAGDTVRPMLESWLPTKRHLWQRSDHEAAELALSGLVACGGAGLERVTQLAGEKGKLAEAASQLLAKLGSNAQTGTLPREDHL